MPVILATQEAENRRIMVQSQTRQIIHETLPLKNPSHTHTQTAGGVARGVGPEFSQAPVPQIKKRDLSNK
jgi:hypothetical protein